MRAATRLCVAVLTAVSVLSPAADADAAGIEWRPCPQDRTAQCGKVRVPLDWSRPYGPKIDLAVYRRPATDPSARIGSLIHGYPAISGLTLITGFFPPEVSRRFDLVSWDARGVGANSIRCSADLVTPWWRLVYPGARLPRNQADLDRVGAASTRLFADCREHTGPVFDHTHAPNDARDLDAIRAALGEEKLTYYGASYGTMAGQAYAERFPHRVRAVVLDSVVDHSLSARGWWEAQATGTQAAFDEFVRWNERTPASALHGRDARAIWHDLLARADRGQLPAETDPPRPARPEELVNVAYDGLTNARLGELARTLADVAAGEPVSPMSPPSDRGPGAIDVSEAKQCVDLRQPVRDYAEFARLLRRTARIMPDMRHPTDSVAYALFCHGVPTMRGNPPHGLKVRNAATPLLVVNSKLDANTSYLMATNMARQLGPNGVLLTYEGLGHGVYLLHRSPCADAAVERYLLTQTLPRPGTHCPAVDEAPLDGGTGQPVTLEGLLEH